MIGQPCQINTIIWQAVTGPVLPFRLHNMITVQVH